MKVLIAPDSYKGSLSALQVAEAMARGWRRRWPKSQVRLVPMADGGEGTTLALVEATGGRLERRRVQDPLGEQIDAYFGLLGGGKTAVVEVAQATGLPLVPPDKRNPLLTTSYGTGQLIKAALDKGCNELILGIGGSATNDGGMGLLSALGVRFLNRAGEELLGCGENLGKIETIDLVGFDPRFQGLPVKVACDVANPLCGPNGASAVYGPQKGASRDMVNRLDEGLAHYGRKIREFLGKDVAHIPGSGAAGGIGAGLVGFLNAQLIPGVALVMETVGMDDLVREADLVLTGEGQTDGQTAYGKAPMGVAQLAKKYGKPVVCISGSLGEGSDLVLEQGVDALFSICPGPISLEEAMARGEEILANAIFQIASLWGAAQGK